MGEEKEMTPGEIIGTNRGDIHRLQLRLDVLTEAVEYLLKVEMNNLHSLGIGTPADRVKVAELCEIMNKLDAITKEEKENEETTESPD